MPPGYQHVCAPLVCAGSLLGKRTEGGQQRADNRGRTEEGRYEAFGDFVPSRPKARCQVRDLVSVGDFLAPEMHRTGGIDQAATAVREWADDDVAMIQEA